MVYGAHGDYSDDWTRYKIEVKVSVLKQGS